MPRDSRLAVPSLLAAIWLAGAFCLSSEASAQALAGADWRVYGGDAGHTRYSTLDQIEAENVDDLTIAWTWSGANFGARPEAKLEVTPLAVDGILYTTAGSRRSVVAIDGATGETLWMYRMDEGARGQRGPRGGSGRGVAYWTDGGEARILALTPGYRLVALDATDGQPIEGFGHDGVVDLMEWIRGRDLDPIGRIGASSPPLVIGDVVVVGAALQVGFRPPTIANIPGDVYGIDVRTGERVWTFHTVPRPGEFGYDSWESGSAEYTGNAAVWAPMSADLEAGLIYLPVEAATHDYYGGHRPGDNLFSTSLVALDAASGERVWHQQIIHHDIWDWDNPTAPILADVTVEGTPRKLVVQLTKQSFAYVFDRETGEPIWPIVEREVPESDVPGEVTSPTQPFPTRPAAYDRQGVSVDDLIDFTPELRAEAIDALSDYRLGEFFQPASLRNGPDSTVATLILPGSLGGTNWEGGAIDPVEGLLFVASMTSPSAIALAPDPDRSEMDYVVASARVPRVQGLPIVKPPYGRITAIDLSTGQHLWMMANADTPEEFASSPALEGVEIPRTGIATRAGLMVTETLLFAGEGYGGGAVFRAHDKRTGEILAEIELPSAQTGIPMTYEAGGQQFIVLSVGAPNHPGELVALTIR